MTERHELFAVRFAVLGLWPNAGVAESHESRGSNMNHQDYLFLSNRRRFLRDLGFGAALFTVPGAFAAELVRTPPQTEGPFYPDKLPLDTDNDLLILNDAITPAVGEVTWLSGRVLDSRGQPIRNALVEIWQCDNNGAYLHSKTGSRDKRDVNF